jgi:hypothetical protein
MRTVHGDTTRHLGNRRAYRGVSLPTPCVSGRLLFLTWARPAQLPHLMLVGGLETREGLQPEARGRASPAPSTGRHVAAPDPFPGGGESGPSEAG